MPYNYRALYIKYVRAEMISQLADKSIESKLIGNYFNN